MKILVISSSLDAESRSEQLAKLCVDALVGNGVDATLLRLKDHPLTGFDNHTNAARHPAVEALRAAVSEADGLVLASPVYNWDCCSELKKFIEHLGSTDAARGLHGVFYDKVVTFVNAAGLPHSYMAFTSLANSLMLDFKCIISPYNLYVHNRHWQDDQLVPEASARLKKSMAVMGELTSLLKARAYRSTWEI